MIRFLIKILALLLTLPLLSFDLFQSDKTSILVKARDTTNQSTPFYIFVKETSFAEFLKDDYHKIVQEQLQDSSKFLEIACIIPGDTKLIQFKTPEKNAVALYCLFTNPGNEWKYFIDTEGPRKVKILMGDNEIQATSRF